MKNTLSNVLIFAMGAVAGSLVTWKFVKTKYEQIANEDIADVKEYYASKYGEGASKEDEPEEDDEEEFDEYETELETNGYTSAATEGVKAVTKPYVIPPDEFGDCDYDMETLYYYADGVLTDDQGNRIEDVDNVVGKSSLSHFGEYEEDSVHVRNEQYKTDYEILRDEEKYSDAINRNPHPTEDE